MSIRDLLVVRPDNDHIADATISASSEQEGYEAVMAATDDPSEPWWADSGTAWIQFDWPAPVEIDTLALIMNNADEGRAITVDGLSSPITLVGIREASGYPRDLVVVLDEPVSTDQLRLSISSNTNKWAIGRVVAGLRTELPSNLLAGCVIRPFRQQYSDVYPDFRHDIRYDIGVEGWMAQGDLIAGPAGEQQAIDTWWFSTKAGYLASLVIPERTIYPPIWARLMMDLARRHYDPETRITFTPLEITPLSRGREVVG